MFCLSLHLFIDTLVVSSKLLAAMSMGANNLLGFLLSLLLDVYLGVDIYF